MHSKRRSSPPPALPPPMLPRAPRSPTPIASPTALSRSRERGRIRSPPLGLAGLRAARLIYHLKSPRACGRPWAATDPRASLQPDARPPGATGQGGGKAAGAGERRHQESSAGRSQAEGPWL